MKYQVSLYGGENIILDDGQYSRILSAWDAGADEFSIGGRRIPRKAISYLGFTKEAAEQIRIDESQYERSLPPDEQKKLREKKYEYALRAVSRKNTESIESGRNSYERRWKSIGNPDVIAVIGKEDGISLHMSSEESENGDAEYYLDGSGNKMFS